MNKIYVAGPMKGIINYNEAAFDYATEQLRARGWFVFSPAEHDREVYGPDILISETGDYTDCIRKGFNLRAAAFANFEFITKHANYLYMLPRWESSTGALAEWHSGRMVGCGFFYAPQMPTFDLEKLGIIESVGA